jgi:colanic acid biosynthesis glycosyl transferase WcaI
LRVLIHGLNYAPEKVGVGRYTGEMAEWLVSQGHEVRVVTAPPYYPAWRIGEGYSPRRYRRERLAGVDVRRCPLWVPESPSGLKRLLHLLSFAVSSSPVVLRYAAWRPDVVVMVEPTLFCLPPAWMAARLSGAPLWVHVQDFELEAALELGILQRSGVRRMFYATEKTLLRGADRLSTITETMRRRVVEKGVPAQRTTILPNWSDTRFVRPLEPDPVVRHELGAEPGETLVMYAGNMGEKQGLEVVLEAAERLRGRREIKFVLIGEGAARRRLERAAAERGLDNVRFFPLQPGERLPEVLAAGDVHLVVQRRGAADLVMPSKLTNILAAGRPAVATADPGTELYRVLTERGCGVATIPEDAGDLVTAIEELADDPDKREQLGRNARGYAEENLDQEKLLRRFEAELKSLADG